MLDVRRHKRSTIPWHYKKDIFPWKKFMENSIPLSPKDFKFYLFFKKKKSKNYNNRSHNKIITSALEN